MLNPLIPQLYIIFTKRNLLHSMLAYIFISITNFDKFRKKCLFYPNHVWKLNHLISILALGVLVIFGSRIPSQITSLIIPATPFEGQIRLFIFICSNIPLYLCSALNPWMFAYHNLELKPVMRRLLKRLCRGLHR